MITYYNKRDLVKFGNWLLSDERKQRLQTITHPNDLEQRLSEVSDADISNFLEPLKKED